jgi:hypothetical protein
MPFVDIHPGSIHCRRRTCNAADAALQRKWPGRRHVRIQSERLEPLAAH